MQEINQWATIIVAILGSGGFATLITVIASRRKNKADASAVNVKSILDIDERLNERIARLEERVTALENENLELRKKSITMEHENELLKQEVKELKEENGLLKERVELLQKENAILKGADNE